MPKSRFTSAQHSEISTTAVQLLAADSVRVGATIQNTGQNTIWLGLAAVTKLTGLPLDAGKTETVTTTAAVFGICDTALAAHTVVTETLSS